MSQIEQAKNVASIMIGHQYDAGEAQSLLVEITEVIMFNRNSFFQFCIYDPETVEANKDVEITGIIDITCRNLDGLVKVHVNKRLTTDDDRLITESINLTATLADLHDLLVNVINIVNTYAQPASE